MPTLAEAIAHYEAITEVARVSGDKTPASADIAQYLKRLRHYEACIASGELVWKKQKGKKQ